MESIVWSEGLLLKPHHFQQQDALHRDALTQRTRWVCSDLWGVAELEVSQNQLENGIVELTRLQALFPDGTAIDLHGAEARRLSVSVQEAPVTVWLVLPAEGQVRLDEDQAGRDAPRQVVWRTVASDVQDGAGEEEIAFSRPNPHLSLSPPDSSQTGLPILRVSAILGQDVLRLDHGFIPPVLNANRVEPVRAPLAELLALLERRSQQLGHLIRRSRVSLAARLNETLALAAVNRALSAGRFLASRRSALLTDHLQWLLALAADLAALEGQSFPDETLPDYDHARPGDVLEVLLPRIRQALAGIYQSRATSVEIRASKPGWHLATFQDSGLLRGADIVLAIKADLGGQQFSRVVRQQIKIAAPGALRDLVSLQLPGMELAPLSVIPADLPTLNGYHYFTLSQEGRFWKDVLDESALAIHVSGDVPGLDLAMWSVRRSAAD